MSADISYRKRPGAEEELRMPVILQLLLACLSPPHVVFSFLGSLIYNVREQQSVKIL
jgi:hypothetical protein